MNIHKLKIGDTFIDEHGSWQVTDIGSRVVVAVNISNGWVKGPPYPSQEKVFDEVALSHCRQNHDLDHLGLPSDLASDEDFHSSANNEDEPENVIYLSGLDDINDDDDNKSL